MARKVLGILLGYVLLAVIVVPLLVTAVLGGFRTEAVTEAKNLFGPADYLQILRPVHTELEAYVQGVVAAEMPALFPMEALKAQAVAARTYQVRKMAEAGSDTVLYDVGQAYDDTAAQKEKWGENYGAYAARVSQAVEETAGEIMVYEGEPILAVFHAQSGGKTENSENVWVQAIPYLRSVDSSGDLSAPDNTVTETLSAQTVWEGLSSLGSLGVTPEELAFSDIQRSQAGYIQQIQAGNLTLTGLEVRTALGLRSADFTVQRQGDDFVFTTKGYGHGAGMSQYGAKSLAEEGMDYREILSHYYTGISFEKTA